MAKMSDMEIVAKALKVNPQTVRRGLEQGCYPFGTAVKCEKSYSYQFFPRGTMFDDGFSTVKGLFVTYL